MKRALVTAANRCFFGGAVALLKGARRHHPEIERWCYVLPEEEAEAKALFGHLAHVQPMPRKIAGVPDEMQICVAKLFAPMIDAESVLYVDADAIFCRPAPELWDVERGMWNVIRDSSPNVLATVPEGMRPEFAVQFPGILEKQAFNGGVWALSPSEFRDLPERYEAALAAGAYKTYHPIFDQPMLNAVIQPRVTWLPFKYNVNNLFDNRIPRDARIVHYTGGQCKPWDPRYPKHEPQYVWWLRHGLDERRPSKLLLAEARVWAATPKRLIGPRLRRWLERKASNW